MSVEVMRAIVRVAHEIPDRAPLRLQIGERVEVGPRDTEWPEFVFVTTAHGTGWVPARHLSGDAAEATARRSYDTTELPTLLGEVLEIIEVDRASGWYWCQNSDGRIGWVPIKTVEIFAE